MAVSAQSGKSSQSEDWWSNFRQLLDSEIEWPSEYVFKFIVPKQQLEDVKGLFGDEELVVRASSKGKYLSITARVAVETPEDVIAIYTAAGSIEGVISL